MSTPTELSTNQRLAAAVARLLPLGELPLREDVIALAQSPTGFVARRLAEEYLAMAEKRCAEVAAPLHTVAERLARHVADAADLAYDVRTVAQGTTARAPHRHVWLLLVAVLTCLTIAAEGNPVAREKLRADVAGVAMSLTDL